MEPPREVLPPVTQHYRPVPPHRARLPDPSGVFKKAEPEDRAFLIELIGALQRELDRRVLLDTARAELLLFAPGGEVFAVRCSSSGVLSTHLVSGPPPP